MFRRSHKKSRGGCLECKGRHVKCDEGRPVCLLCTMSGRDCSFASQSRPEALATPGASSSLEPSSSPGINSQVCVSLPDADPLSAASLSNRDSPETPSVDNRQDPTLDAAVNLNHMELLIHLVTDKDKGLSHLGIRAVEIFSFGLNTALESPYLLHAILALSSRHLAFLKPARAEAYLHQADTLQTRAVSLFNAAWTSVDASNCVAVLLFSSILGQHLLTDTLARRDHGSGSGRGLDAFMAHYVQCVEMHRGISSIANSAWPQLMESQLEPVLSWSRGFTARAPRGDHCRRAGELVDGAEGLAGPEREACRRAVGFLQVGFDAALAEEEEHAGDRFQMILSWIMLAPPEFTALLTAKRPEALVLLAYYALLLHYGRGMWQVGNSGAYILSMIVDYLGPEWEYWLEYPRERVAQDE